MGAAPSHEDSFENMDEDTVIAHLKGRKNTHFMLVEGMSKLRTHNVKTCQSSVFQVSGHKWKLILHPAGIDGKSNHLSLHLRIKDKESLGSTGEVKCTLKLMAMAPNQPKKCHSVEWPFVCYNAQKAIHGEDNFITHEVLNERYLVNDKVVFCAEVTNVQSNCAGTVIPRTIGTGEHLKLMEVARNNCRFTWKITQFSSFESAKHSSYEFTVGPRRWFLVMCPKGSKTGKGNSLSLYLKASDYVTQDGPNAKTLAVYKLRVLDQLHRNHYETVHGHWLGYQNRGRHQFLPLEKLNDPSNGFLVRDQMYVGVEFLLNSTTEYL